MNKKNHLIPAALCAAVFCCAGHVAAEEKAAGPAMPPPAVLVEKVALIPDTQEKRYVGRLQAINSVSLPARVSGVLLKRHFKEGSLVKAGDLLFEIEDTTYRAARLRAEAEVQRYEAELAFAQTNYARQKGLLESSAVSQQVYEEAKRTLDTIKAALAGAKANLLDAENNLSYTRISAPITGIIGKAAYDEGNYITPSSGELANIVQTTPLYAVFALSDRDCLDMFSDREDMKKNAEIRLLLSNGEFYAHKGRISFLDNRFDQKTATLMVWASVDNPSGMLLPGGYAPVLVRNASASARPAVTLSSVMTTDKGNSVYLLGKDGKVEVRKVETGRVIGRYQLILDGLQEGETVIADGTHKVRPGMIVRGMTAEDIKAMEKGR